MLACGHVLAEKFYKGEGCDVCKNGERRKNAPKMKFSLVDGEVKQRPRPGHTRESKKQREAILEERKKVQIASVTFGDVAITFG